MNLVTIFAGLCAFMSASVIGLWIKKRFIRKAVFYEGYYDYLQFCTEKICYERMPIGELNEAFFKKNKGEFVCFLQKNETNLPLSEETVSEIRDYLQTIGTTDAETQVASLRAKCAEMKRFTETECVKFKKDGALYFKLSALVGAVLFIILV